MAIKYRGITLPFGKHQDSTTERAEKIISFPAVNGTQEMDMGKRQRSFTVKGLIIDMLTGSFLKSTIEDWNDGGVGTLDIHGLVYSKVKMESCSFSRAYKNAVTNKITCEFAIQFKKLS
ncbi:MAG: DNA circularization N-terminal domain-containing protein [Patescibacteria group bacterium]|nr:DNA circularization N-terminal domain-containing protein [Patescibacteria group bacterium]